MSTEREFNIFGPINPELHYHVDRIEVKAKLHEKVAKGRYLTLNASRQTGKTTLFNELIIELEKSGDYFGILLDFESLASYTEDLFYEELGYQLADWRETYQPEAPEPSPMRRHGDFIRWLRRTTRAIGKKSVLIIDEFDSVDPEISVPMLSSIRGMYIQRYKPNADSAHSVLLVGVKTIPALLGGSQSPFNIADQFTVPYFSQNELKNLLAQHTDATGQPFEERIFDEIYAQTEGQPFLVNRLGQMLTKELDIGPDETITQRHLDEKLVRLVNENNTHFSSIKSKASLYRSEVIKAIFGSARYYDFQDEVTQELLMYGVLRTVADEAGREYARIANPIYQKVLVKAFAPTNAIIDQATNGSIYQRFVVEDSLNFDGLLDSFKAFMEEHGVRLLKSEKSHRPLEISGQYLLLSYLTAALKGIGGEVTIESLSNAGEMDILALYRKQRFIVEVKIWYSQSKYEEAQSQLTRYLRAAGLSKGYLVIFDEKLDKNKLLQEKGDIFEISVDQKILRVYLVGITI